MRTILLILTTIILVWSSCSKAPLQPTAACEMPLPDSSDQHPKAQELQQLLDAYTHRGLPGIALLVRDAHGRWLGASGMADLAQNQPMAPCQVSKVASVTKIFVGALVMQLVEDGVLSLDDPLTKWLPDKYTGKIANAGQATLRQLLNHSSGIPDLIEQNSFYLTVLNDPAHYWTPDELLEYVYGLPAVFEPPGATVEYSNTNLLLAVMAIEAATGRSHADLMRERIFGPLALYNTYYHWHDPLPNTTAQGYFDLYNNGNLLQMSNFNTGSGNGYGGIYSNVLDMQLFIEALLRDQTLLSEAALAEMTRISAVDWVDGEAYGVTLRRDFLDRPDGEQGIGHRGRDLAYTADLFYFPNQDATIAYLINYGTDGNSRLREVFFDFRNEVIDILLAP